MDDKLTVPRAAVPRFCTPSGRNRSCFARRGDHCLYRWAAYLDMSTYRVEPDGMSGFRVVQTLTGGHRGRIVGNFPSRRAAEAWAEIQSEIEVSEAQPPVPESGRGERRSEIDSDAMALIPPAVTTQERAASIGPQPREPEHGKGCVVGDFRSRNLRGGGSCPSRILAAPRGSS
jgi:hypothetical protein